MTLSAKELRLMARKHKIKYPNLYTKKELCELMGIEFKDLKKKKVKAVNEKTGEELMFDSITDAAINFRTTCARMYPYSSGKKSYFTFGDSRYKILII